MRIVGLAIAVLSLAACSSDRQAVSATPTSPTLPPTSPPVSRIVRGTVLDFQTAKPIAGATIGFGTSASASSVLETTVSDENGRYALPEPPLAARNGPYSFLVNGAFAGQGYPKSSSYRGDVAVDRGLCVSRYGMVLDSTTFLPIAGAVALDLSNRVVATSDKDGWYQIDWGCGVGQLGFNTRWNIMTHPNYTSRDFASGRGIGGVSREDVILNPK